MAASPRMHRRFASMRSIFLAPVLVLAVATALSACSTPPSGPPSAPTDVSATGVAGAVRVTWTDTSNNESGFVIFRETLAPTDLTGQAFAEIGRTGPNVESYDDLDVEPGSDYVYQVAATNAGGTSALAPDGGTTPASPLPAVALTLTFDGSGVITVEGGGATRECDADCTLPYGAGDEVTLTATGTSGLTFAGWSGACEGAGACTLTLDADMEVGARFRQHVLTVRMLGDTSVEADVSPPESGTGIVICDLSSGEACAVAYDSPLTAGINVGLDEPGAVLDGFSGCDTTGPASYCLVGVSGDTVVTVTARRVPDAVSDGTYQTDEDVALTVPASGGVLDNDVDSPGDTLRAVLDDAPTHGTLDLADDGGFTYTPAANYFGQDAFTYHAVDAYGNVSDTVDAQLSVTPVNDAPVAASQSVYTEEDPAAPLPITLSATDIENDPVTFAVQTQPSNGTLGGTAPDLTYMPDPDFDGTDSFTFTASDGQDESAPATITIQVGAIADAPVGVSDAYVATEDTVLNVPAVDGVLANDMDAEGDIVAAELVATTTDGTLDLAPDGGFTYTPALNFDGSDAFTYRAVDAVGNRSADVSVTIDVTPVNDAPVASDGSKTLPEDGSEQIALSASDVDGDSLTYIIVNQPAHGDLTGSGATRTYTPDADYFGPDSFTFKVNDGEADSNTATVDITVTAVNDVPVADDKNAVAEEDGSVGITLSGSDVEGSSLTYTVVDAPDHGDVTGGSGPNRTYTPDPNYHGSDSFTYRVNDGEANSGVATVSITVTPVNDPPVANDQSVSTPEDTAKVITLVGTDIDGDTLTYIIVNQPAHGDLTGSGATRTYTPDANYFGPDSFTFRVYDGNINSNIATVSITVTAVNDTPVADDKNAVTLEDTPVDITFTGSDVEGTTLSFAIDSDPAHGTLSGSGATRTYTPDLDFHGSDSFTYTASDGGGVSAPATVSITVTPVNDPPSAQSQNVGTTVDTPVDITLAGSDPEGDPLTFSVTASPASGTLSGAAPDLTYTPDAAYVGPDSFTFVASDGEATSQEATVAIDVDAL